MKQVLFALRQFPFTFQRQPQTWSSVPFATPTQERLDMRRNSQLSTKWRTDISKNSGRLLLLIRTFPWKRKLAVGRRVCPPILTGPRRLHLSTQPRLQGLLAGGEMLAERPWKRDCNRPGIERPSKTERTLRVTHRGVRQPCLQLRTLQSRTQALGCLTRMPDEIKGTGRWGQYTPLAKERKEGPNCLVKFGPWHQWNWTVL